MSKQLKVKKNIIFFLPNFGYGGAANSIFNLSKNLNKKKYNIFIFCLGKCSLKRRFYKFGIKVFEIKKARTLFSFFEIKKKIKYIKKNFEGKTIFVSNINYANSLSVLFLKKSKEFKIILVERTPIQELNYSYNNFNIYIKNLIIKLLMKLFYKKSNIVIGNSKKVSIDISNFCKIKVRTIYPYHKIENKIFNKKKYIFTKKTFIILVVSRLSKEKNIETIIKSLKFLSFKNYKLLIAGKGGENNFLKKLSKDLNLAKKITFLGNVKNLKKIYNKSNLFVIASKYEGFPNSVIDAIKYKTPILCSRSFGAIKEIMGNLYNNSSFEIDNYQKLADKINHIRNNYNNQKRNSEQLLKNINKLNLQNSIKNYEKIFDKL